MLLYYQRCRFRFKSSSEEYRTPGECKIESHGLLRALKRLFLLLSHLIWGTQYHATSVARGVQSVKSYHTNQVNIPYTTGYGKNRLLVITKI